MADQINPQTGEVTVYPVELSPACGALAAALAAAQGKIGAALKDRTARITPRDKPSYSFTYADLGSIWEACRAALAEQKLAVLQPVASDGRMLSVTTILAHASGEWARSTIAAPLMAGASDPKQIGILITYLRKYGLASMVGVSYEENGEAAEHQPRPHERAPTSPPREPGEDEGPSVDSAVAAAEVKRLKEARERLHNEGAGEPEIRAWRRDVGRLATQKKITPADVDVLRAYHKGFAGEVDGPGVEG